MKRLLFLFALVIAVAAAAALPFVTSTETASVEAVSTSVEALPAGVAEELALGAKAPMANEKLQNIDGSYLTLTQAAGAKGLLVVFSCNTCPFVIGNGEKSEGWEGRYNGLAATAKANGIGMVLVNSNEAKRGGDDSFAEMKKHAKAAGYTMPYLLDANHRMADAFGAMKTPHVYLFNSKMELVYRGAIDDNVSSAADAKKHYLKDALEALGTGAKIKTKSTPAMGCSIKRNS
jgi:uncharacterized protein (UPF0333 family)